MSNRQYDLIIIGAGVLGTFHAYHALKKGLKVLLLEKDIRPQGATVRNFGQVVPSGMVGKWFEYGRRSLEIYKEIQHIFDISVRNSGSLYIASDTEEQQLLHEVREIFAAKNYSSQQLSQKQCLEQWPSLRPEYVKEGLLFPDELNVAPDKMIHRLLQYLQQSFEKFTFFPSCAATHIDINGSNVLVHTANEINFTAHKVMICNGAEFRLLFPELYKKSGLIVSKLQMLRTLPMPEVKLNVNLLTGLSIRRYESFSECSSYPHLATPAHYQELQDWGIHILFKQATDGSMILGDSHEYAPAVESRSLGYEIRQFINDLIIKEASRIVSFKLNIDTSWTGFYSQHPDEIFTMTLEDKVHIITGIGGKGMTSSAGFAESNLAHMY